MFKRHLRSIFVVPSFAKFNRVPEDDESEGEGKVTKGGSGGKADDEEEEEKPVKKKAAKTEEDDSDLSASELAKLRAENAKLKKASDKAAQEKKDADTKRLKDENNWKAVAEAKEAEALESKSESEKIKTSYINDRKFSALESAAKALGLRPEAVGDLEALDLEDLLTETTSTGKINVLGVEKFAKALKTKKPHWFSDKPAPKVNTNGTRILDSSDDAISAKDLLKAEAEGKKSGDLSNYYALHKKYQQQRAAAR